MKQKYLKTQTVNSKIHLSQINVSRKMNRGEVGKDRRVVEVRQSFLETGTTKM